MPTAIQQQTAELGLAAATREITSTHPAHGEEFESIFALLATAPADLGRISESIRQHPELAALMHRIAASLFLAPENSLDTLEQAVVVLGTGRLRVLIQLWSTFRAAGTSVRPAGALKAETAPESPDIAAFLSWLGQQLTVSSGVAQLKRDRAIATDDLSEVFMRDFFSLLPALEKQSANVGAAKARAAALFAGAGE